MYERGTALTDDISRELWTEHLLNVGSNLHVSTSTCGTEILNSSNLIPKPDSNTKHSIHKVT